MKLFRNYDVIFTGVWCISDQTGKRVDVEQLICQNVTHVDCNSVIQCQMCCLQNALICTDNDDDVGGE